MPRVTGRLAQLAKGRTSFAAEDVTLHVRVMEGILQRKTASPRVLPIDQAHGSV